MVTRAALLIVYDFLEPRFAHLNLGAQFLDLRRCSFTVAMRAATVLLQVVHGTVLLEVVSTATKSPPRRPAFRRAL